VVTVTPYNHTVEVTSNVTIVAKVTGTGVKHFEYQWRHNGRIIKGKNNDTLVIYNARKSDSGDYICIISNNYVDRVSSNKVQLVVIGMYVSLCILMLLKYYIVKEIHQLQLSVQEKHISA